MKQFGSFFLFLALILISGLAVSAQETQDRVVDEVVAQVNDGVITLSKVNREVKGIIDAETSQGKNRDEVAARVEQKRGELIANLIHEELLVQKAKELGYEGEIDASVNKRFSEIMKQYNLKTVEQLYQEMEKTGVHPEEIRDIWKKQATRDVLLQKEVQGPIYWGLTSKELKDYYDKHRDKFTKPETITLSEIFLSFAGRDEMAVREKAKQLVAELKAGGDWDKISKENSDPPVLTEGGRKLKVADISPFVVNALRDLKLGAITNPIPAEQIGVLILRVDAREQASSESYFDENAVRVAITMERAPAAQKKYFADLRSNSYIKVNDTYRPLVSPILFEDDRKEQSAAAVESTSTTSSKKETPKEKPASKESSKNKTANKDSSKNKEKEKVKANR